MPSITKPVLTTDYSELLTPGVQVELDPEQAADEGAFEETALSEADAWESNGDLVDADVAPAAAWTNVVRLRSAALANRSEAHHG